MKEIVVMKDELLKILRENREGHLEIFNEAVEGYKREALKTLREHLGRVEAGQRRGVYISLPVPVNHTKDYDRVIKMVEMNQGDTIELTESDASMYLMDDWNWKGQFLTTNSQYSVGAAQALEG